MKENATWMDADIDELRTLYADGLKDLEYEYGVRCAYENAVDNAIHNCPYIDTVLAGAWMRCVMTIMRNAMEFSVSQ